MRNKIITKDAFIYLEIKERDVDRELSLMINEGYEGKLSLEAVSFRGEVEPKLQNEYFELVKHTNINLMSINSICDNLLEPNLKPSFKIYFVRVRVIKPKLNGEMEDKITEVDLDMNFEDIVKSVIKS